MSVRDHAPLMHLRGRILLLLASTAIAILVPAFAIWSFERNTKDTLYHVTEFHDATVDLAYEGMRITGELRVENARSVSSGRQEWSRRQRYYSNELLRCVGTIAALHEKFIWQDDDATVARLLRQMQELDAAIATGPEIDPPARH